MNAIDKKNKVIKPVLYPGRTKSYYSGFTLIELMMVVAIIGILASVAFPAYEEHVKRSKRTQAMSAVQGAAQAMERYRANNYNYGVTALSDVYATQIPLDGGEVTYNLTLSNTPDTEFTITATAVETMEGDGNFTLNDKGEKSWNSKNCWPETGSSDCTPTIAK